LLKKYQHAEEREKKRKKLKTKCAYKSQHAEHFHIEERKKLEEAALDFDTIQADAVRGKKMEKQEENVGKMSLRTKIINLSSTKTNVSN
jgi:hypothetical protein